MTGDQIGLGWISYNFPAELWQPLSLRFDDAPDTSVTGVFACEEW